MRGGWRLWGIVIVLPVLHFLLHVGLGASRWSPDLLTVALLVGARELRTGTAAGLGFVFGILEDAFSVLAFGANALAMTVLGILGARSREVFVGDSLLFLISYLALGKWFRDLLHWLVSSPEVRGALMDDLVVDGAVGAGYAAVVGAFVVLVVGVWREPVA